MEDLIAAVYDVIPADRIKILLQQHSLDSLHQPDDNGLDVLHHAILANNPDIVQLLQEMGFSFSDPLPESETRGEGAIKHLHLACLVCNSCALKTLCQFSDCGDVRVGCSRRLFPKANVLRKYLQRARNHVLTDEKLETWSLVYKMVQDGGGGSDDLFPVDIAAMFDDFGCLQILLDVGTSKSNSRKRTMLEQAAEMKSVLAFRFLLGREPEPPEVNSALRFCLSHKLLEFLRVLLDYGVDVRAALNGNNPYHFLFLCSSQLQGPRIRNPLELSLRNRGVVEVTSFLLERGFDVNTRLPIGTYPLYSLVTAIVLEKDHNPTQVPTYHLDVLETILRCGADGNFDEVRHLDAAGVPREAAAFTGRELSTSALNCYFSCLQSCDTWRPHIMEHLDRLCLTLLENGANPDYVDAYGRTPLHDLMHAMASQHSIGHMHADLSTMSRMLLYFGANPNCQSGEGEYPVECYFSKILTVMGGLLAFRRWKDSNNIPQVLHLLYFMDTADSNEACRRILLCLKNSGTNNNARVNSLAEDGDSEEESYADSRSVVPDDLLEYVSSLTHEYVCHPKTLQELTQLVLWKSVSRKVHVLRKLRMPKAFLASIKVRFELDV